MLVPLAYLQEFQQVIQDAQKLAAAPPVQALPKDLLADLARVSADPDVVIRYEHTQRRIKAPVVVCSP